MKLFNCFSWFVSFAKDVREMNKMTMDFLKSHLT